MNISSSIAKVVSLLISLGVVAGAAQLSIPKAAIETQGGGLEVAAQIGSRFEDMTAGVLTSTTTQDRAIAVKVKSPAKVIEPQILVPAVAKAVRAIEPAALATPPAIAIAATPAASAVAALPPVAQPLQVAPRPVEMALRAIEPQTIVAQEPDSVAPTLSRRPIVKNLDLAAKAAETQKDVVQAKRKVVQKKAQKSAARGTAKRNNTKGTKSGTRKTAKAKTTGEKNKSSSKAGNAAASNYPGKVMRRISRQARPRVRAKGTATISFSISSGGGLSRVSVSRSSGSSALDRAAVAMVRKASPFPRPPAGAQRKFLVRVQGVRA